jgi:hypothetical protein
MARPRAFDYDLLEKLVTEHPTWPLTALADALWEDNKHADPDAPPVKAVTVASVLTRMRYQGSDIPIHNKVFGELLPPPGLVASGHTMARPLLLLREIAKERRGEPAKPGDEAKLRGQALRWEQNLPLMGSIVDLDSAGVPIIRRATAAELGEDGRPAALAAWLLPGWRPPQDAVA